MALVLHGHPFSSYTQKVLIALYETATPFTRRVLDGPPAFGNRFFMPFLFGQDGGQVIVGVGEIGFQHDGPAI